MANYRVKIGSTDLGLALAVIDLGWDSILSWQRDKDSATYSFNPKSEFVLNCSRLPATWGADKPAVFNSLIASEDDCNIFQVSIEQECEGSYTEVWTGEFSSKDWKSDRTKQTIRVKASKENPFDCIRENWKDQKNPYDLIAFNVRATYNTYELFEDVFVQTTPGEPCPPPITVPNYCYFDLVESYDPTQPPYPAVVCGYLFHRYRQAGYCVGASPQPPDDYNDWQLLTNNCPTSSEWYYCPEDGRVVHLYPNARNFGDVLEFLVSETGCGLTVVSNFFDINSDATNPSNAAYTAAEAFYQRLAFFQKSDIKRHDASDPSRPPSWFFNLEDFWHDIKIMFNLNWSIDGTTLRIEHVSYFEAGAGNDYTGAMYERVLEQDRGEVPATHRFKFRDADNSDYFKGYPITTYCGDGEKEDQLRLFSTDVEYIRRSDGLEDTGDDGFVLACTEQIGPTRYIIDNNRPLSWQRLHYNFYRFDMAGAGTINDADVTPISLRPTRKQPSFIVKHCCDNTFDPIDLVTTALGDGQVQSAEWNLAKDYLQLDLKY